MSSEGPYPIEVGLVYRPRPSFSISPGFDFEDENDDEEEWHETSLGARLGDSSTTLT